MEITVAASFAQQNLPVADANVVLEEQNLETDSDEVEEEASASEIEPESRAAQEDGEAVLAANGSEATQGQTLGQQVDIRV